MTARPDEIPPALRSLIATLETAGFAVSEESPLSFGNWMVVLESGGLRVRLIRERAQWFLQASGADWGDEWFDPITWRAYLDGHADTNESVPIETQANELLTLEPRIRSVLATDAHGALAALIEIRSESVYRSLGFAEDDARER